MKECHYKHVNLNLMKKSIDNFDWKKDFEGCKPNKQVDILTGTIFNIICNFIPNKAV